MDETERLAIRLYLQMQVVSGFLHNPADERITDILSGISGKRSESRAAFLELTDITVQHKDGGEESLPCAYVNKAAVELAMALEADSGRGIGAKTGPRPYPFVEKVAVRVRLLTPGYLVAGNLSRAAHQTVWHVLEEKPMYLPLTNAEVVSLSSGERCNAPFAAVNKEYILFLREEAHPL